MSLFGKLFGGDDAAPAPVNDLPLKLRLGGAVAYDDTMFKANAGVLGFDAPQGNQMIEALGKVDLGAGSHLYRFYLTDDAWLQVNTTGASIDDIKLFVYAETKNPPTKAEFVRWTEPGSQIGSAQVIFEGKSYARVWGDSPAASWTPPVAYDESVEHPVGGEANFDLTHYSMLYQREVPELPGRFEYLFVTAEDYGPEEFCVVYSLGVDVTSADLTIT
ncbi:DUF2491 family protein [Dyella tabacisoli]|uniref:DUF2491 family protein n=1 Tax=Dyella tabacisoli TaxID=2282381 RepID=A0A369UTT8_9GAMM|nr:DUF2491 family protein [Dyella tabacisoli]RDD81749.1 DUF2491 family protein [Dyella tabacisoli]